MEIVNSAAGDVMVVAISGNVDGLTAESLLRALSERVAEGVSRLVVDCVALEYTSSAGLRSLLSAVKLTRQAGGDLRLAAVQPPVMRVLELSGFTSILKHFPDVPGAVSSFSA